MSRLIAIDPGLRYAGVALFENDRFLDGLVTSKNVSTGPAQWTKMAKAIVSDALYLAEGAEPDTLAIELMVTRPGREDVHADLVELSQVSGGVYALLDSERKLAIEPAKWTKGRPKHVNHARVRKRLDEEEKKRLDHALKGCEPSRRKELLDAVGIGLFVLQRW